MKVINLTPQFNQNNNKKHHDKSNVQFKGAFDAVSLGLRFLETNQAWGANAVDLGSMVIPRTVVDFSRGPEAGMETMRREASGTVNHSLIGLYGTAAGLAFAIGMSNKFGVKAEKIFADNNTWDYHGNNWFKHSKDGGGLNSYVDEFLDNLNVFDPEKKAWSAISKDNKAKLAEELKTALLEGEQNKPLTKETESRLRSMFMSAFGTENNFKLTKDAADSYNVKTLISNFYNVTKSFMADKAGDTFKNIKAYDENIFTKAMKNFNVRRSIGGLVIGSAVGMSIQPFNIYLTKKKTGSDGFVGVGGAGKDNSASFKMMKIAAGLAFIAGAVSFIMKPTEFFKKGGVNKFLSKIQFKGVVPTLDQFKLIYGVTIMSRFFASRSKDELRESAIKDTLGFLNWLVLGNFVAKGVAKGLDKSLLYNTDGKKGLKGFFSAGMMTRDEILHGALKKAGISTIKDGKALSYKQLLKLLPATEKVAKSRLRYLNIAQVAGYLYSGLVLGVALPRLNIWMTNCREKKRQTERVHDEMNMYRPENMAFLSKQMNFTAKEFAEN